MISYLLLPTVNAALNASAAVLLGLGYHAIRHGNIARHRRLMLSAVAVSALFLVSYVTYHTLRQMHEGVGHTRFEGPPLLRAFYLAILLSHLVLAIANLPLILIALTRALRSHFPQHAKVARWAWPIWMYVSVTGVVVYAMLYHVNR